jgi:hypothetical protein
LIGRLNLRSRRAAGSRRYGQNPHHHPHRAHPLASMSMDRSFDIEYDATTVKGSLFFHKNRDKNISDERLSILISGKNKK